MGTNDERLRAVRVARLKYRTMQALFVAAVFVVVVYVLAHAGWIGG